MTADYDKNKIIPVFQSYKFGKYLGRFDITFDDNGEVISNSWEGSNPILLDKSVPQGRHAFDVKKYTTAIHLFNVQIKTPL